ncbi:hypothetical protein D1872_227880 [compost metagenome]
MLFLVGHVIGVGVIFHLCVGAMHRADPHVGVYRAFDIPGQHPLRAGFEQNFDIVNGVLLRYTGQCDVINKTALPRTAYFRALNRGPVMLERLLRERAYRNLHPSAFRRVSAGLAASYIERDKVPRNRLSRRVHQGHRKHGYRIPVRHGQRQRGKRRNAVPLPINL